MKEGRMAALEEIGFESSNNKMAEALWYKRYSELNTFLLCNGHCRVPQNYNENKALGKWVHRQRHQFRKEALDELSCENIHRLAALKKIDFFST